MEVATRRKPFHDGGVDYEVRGVLATIPKFSVPDSEEWYQSKRAVQRLEQPSRGRDPFSLLPPVIDRWQETMLEFYLSEGEPYAATAGRMFKPTMKPWPREERFQVALRLPSMLYSTIARATFHYLRKHQDIDTVKRLELQQCGARLRNEAVCILRKSLLKQNLSKAELGDILAMTTSLATLEQSK